MKRVFSILLALCLILSLLPYGTFAAQDSASSVTQFIEVTQLTADKEYVLGAVNSDGSVSAISAGSSGNVESTVLSVTSGNPASVEAEDEVLVWRYTSDGSFANGNRYLYPSAGSSVMTSDTGRAISFADGQLSFTASSGTCYITFVDDTFGVTSDSSSAAEFRLFESIVGNVAPTSEPASTPAPTPGSPVETTPPPELTEPDEADVYLAFTADVHNQSNNVAANRLNTWINNVTAKTGESIDVMSFCGDNGSASAGESDFWNFTQSVMNVVNNNGHVNDSVFTTGNHEFYNGRYGSTSNATAQKIMRIGEVKKSNNYIIYAFGPKDWADFKDQF